MSPRAKEYQKEVRFPFDNTGRVTRYIRFGMDVESGRVVRCMIQYEVEYNAETFAIVRYDTADGGFHQHLAGLRIPSVQRVQIPGVPSDKWVGKAIADIYRRYPEWELSVCAPWLGSQKP